jgi:2-keto-3-deoxy-L-rhamnonate aldolase RhmA
VIALDIRTLKKKIKSGVPTFGSWITLGHPALAEVMAQAGFDWLVVDMEHSAITLSEAQNLIQVIGLAGVVPLVRVTNNDPNLIKRVMDAGAKGVIVPMVNSPEEARAAVSAVLYPPSGTRGVGLGRAQSYGFTFPEYAARLKEESLVIVQIEHINAVRRLEGILTTPGVDGFLVGPYDLSGSLGVPGQFEHPSVRKALAEIDRTARRLKVPAGFHVIPPQAAEVQRRLKQGYTFISVSLDTLYLGTACREVLAGLKSKTKSKKGGRR